MEGCGNCERIRNPKIMTEIKDWEMEIPIVYNSAIVSVEQLKNMLSLAGIFIGIGVHRPNSISGFNNTHGIFELV